MDSLNKAAFNMSTLLKILNKITYNETRAALLETQCDHLCESLPGVEAAISRTFKIKKKQVTLLHKTSDQAEVEVIRKTVADTLILIQTIKGEAKRIKRDVEFIGDTLAHARLLLAIGTDEHPGYAASSIASSLPPEQPSCVLRQISDVLGDVETINIILIKKADEINARGEDLSPSLMRNVKLINRDTAKRKKTIPTKAA